MKILGIDYGRRKIGLALGNSILAEPYKVIKVDNFENAVKKILQIIKVLQVEQVVVGVSEGEMGEESKKFAERINAKTFDETLSTYDAQKLSIESGMNRKKRKSNEDAFAATVMLQSYIDYV
jgi:putative Holliday junction resolvase